MSSWGWKGKVDRAQSLQRFTAPWLKPYAAAASWLTVFVLLLTLYMIGGTFTAAEGVLFDLPDNCVGDGEATELVALVMPATGNDENLAFFDDARYRLGDSASVSSFSEHLAERAAKSRSKTLMVLADWRVQGGELMKIAALAKAAGVDRVLFAEKRRQEAGE